MHLVKYLISFLFCFSCAEEKTLDAFWHKKSDIMVKEQIERRGIQDPGVLRVMRETPRHLFIP